MVDPTIPVLAQVFPRLPLAAVERMRQAARLVSYPAQVALCHEGEVEHCFYVIVVGQVEVYRMLEGQRLFINQLTVGAHFGDLALLLDVPRTATIITAEPTQVLEIDRSIFSAILQTSPEIAVELSQMVLRRFLAQEEKLLVEISRLRKRDSPPGRVFLSYARTDAPFATRLSNSLLKQQIDVWIDLYRLEPAKSWARQVGDALDQCQVMIVVLSPAAVASENVDDEWNYYLDQKKSTVAVLYEPCKIPYRLSKLQYINFHQVDYDQALARVLAVLHTL